VVEANKTKVVERTLFRRMWEKWGVEDRGRKEEKNEIMYKID
jgi:hypothetical protein